MSELFKSTGLNVGGGYTRESSRAEVQVANFKLSFMDSPLPTLGRHAAEFFGDDSEDIPIQEALIEPERLNKMYPNIDKKFDAAMKGSDASRINEIDKERKDLQHIVQFGKDDAINSTLGFFSAIGGQIVDPISLGVGLATGTLMTNALAKGVMGARAAKAAIALKAATKARKAGQAVAAGATAKSLGVNIAENLIGNIAEELAIIRPIAEEERRSYETIDSVKNAMIGAIAFPVAFKGLELTTNKIRGMLNTAQGRIDAGKKPFGSATEQEAILGTRQAELKAEKVELETKLETETDPNTRTEIELEINKVDVENKKIVEEISDHPKIREEANAPDQDLEYDDNINSQVLAHDINEPLPSVRQQVDLEYEKILENPAMSEAIKTEARADMELLRNQRENTRSFIEASINCARIG